MQPTAACAIIGAAAADGERWADQYEMTDPRTKPLGARLLAETSRWPAAWQGDANDIPVGRALVGAMLPFLRALVASSAAASTLRRHFGNAWVLGGHLVRQASFDPSMRRMAGRDLLLEQVDEEGGPLITGFSTEAEQRSFDSTCRQLLRLLRSRR